MKKDNRYRYTLGMTLIELLVTLAISVILVKAISSAYTFITREYIKSKREFEIKNEINIIKNAMISEYRYHRGDHPEMYNANVYIRPNLNIIRYGKRTERDSINGEYIGKYSGTKEPFPLTWKELKENIDSDKNYDITNTKVLTIEQLVSKINSNSVLHPFSTKVTRIEYNMSCKDLPKEMTTALKARNVTFRNLLEQSNFYSKTKCIKKDKPHALGGFKEGLKVCDENSTIHLRKDVWKEIWNDKEWDNNAELTYYPKPTYFPTRHNVKNSNGAYTTIYHNDILGIAFCTWVPTEQDILTADTTEVELYYFMLNFNSFMNLNNSKAPLRLDVRTEKITLRRERSVTTGVSPLKQHQ